MQIFLNIFRFLIALIGSLAVFIFCVSRWITKTFGKVDIEQLLWNLNSPLIGTDKLIIKSALKSIFLCGGGY